MIVEPTPVHSRAPIRRLARVGAFLAPLVLLVAVVTAGLLGPKPTSATGRVSPPPAPASPAPTLVAGP